MEATKVRYYKVTGSSGESIHGGRMQWSLPTKDGADWMPGEWHETEGSLELCRNGLHLTSEPPRWWADGARCFEVEYEGAEIGDGGDKIAVSKARLVRELVGVELAEVQIFTEGAHVCTRGAVRASGRATVRAYDSATVEAYDSATVRAYGSATVRAYDSATVRASGRATVEASDRATVRASGRATVVSPPHVWGQPTVQVADHAVWIDHRTGKPQIHCLTGEIVRPAAH